MIFTRLISRTFSGCNADEGSSIQNNHQRERKRNPHGNDSLSPRDIRVVSSRETLIYRGTRSHGRARMRVILEIFGSGVRRISLSFLSGASRPIKCDLTCLQLMKIYILVAFYMSHRSHERIYTRARARRHNCNVNLDLMRSTF